MAGVALTDWKEQIRDPKIECMSRDEMHALQSERLVKQVKMYTIMLPFTEKMDELGFFRGILKGLMISINFHLQQKRI